MYHGSGNILELEKPGEYGEGHDPRGWAIIDLSPYNGRRLFLCSEHFANPLRDHHHVSHNNIVRLNVKPTIPEEPLAGQAGLTQFRNKLAVIQNTSEDVLIHCTRGNNRTPVAAYIYMVDKLNIPPQQAKNLVESAMKKRDDEFKLNSRGHYTEAINLVNEQYQKRNQDQPASPPPAPQASNWKKIPEKEVQELLEQKESWMQRNKW